MVDTTISTPVGYKPPFRDAPLDAGKTAFSDAWVGWFTDVSDRLTLITQRVGIAEGDIAGIDFKAGITDGSDAAPGNIGEYLSASGSGALTTATPLDRATLTLTAGDWDVMGWAQIGPTLATLLFAQAWLSTAANTPTTPGLAAIQAQSTTAGVLGNVCLVVGPVRFSVTASTAVHLGCQANFPGTTSVTATAFIRARRMR